MSVFYDFQRLWMERFPQSTLSDTWEQDVHASLERHKLKIMELTKELEQETLYVEYLQRLLSDVEKYRESGGNPLSIFDVTSKDNMAACQENDNDKILSNKHLKYNVKPKDTIDRNGMEAIVTDEKQATKNTHSKKNEDSQEIVQDTNSRENMKVEEVDIFINKNDSHDQTGALQQCISELVASISNSKMSAINSGNSENSTKPSKSQFVTVIEVKENTQKNEKNTEGVLNEYLDNNADTIVSSSTFSSFDKLNATQKLLPATTAASLEARKKILPRPPQKHIRRVEPPTVPTSVMSSSTKRDGYTTASSYSSSDCATNSLDSNIKPSNIIRHKCEITDTKVLQMNRKTTPELNRFTNTTEFLEELGHKVTKSESLGKKKRSDLNNIQATTSSLDRLGSTPSSSTICFNRSICQTKNNITSLPVSSPIKSAYKNDKITTNDDNLISNPGMKFQQSLNSASEISTLENVVRDVGSKESLTSQNVSEIIRSYESVSTISSDSSKTNQFDNENEHLYDTVALDNADDEYVYIKPSQSDISYSSDNLQLQHKIISAVDTQPTINNGSTSFLDIDSPRRIINYANIDYFINENMEAPSNSVDSDVDYEPGMPIMRTISNDNHNSHASDAIKKNLVSAILVSSNQRGVKIRSILNTIIQSETIYVACLNTMLKYKKAIHATLSTSQPVIKSEEANTIFFKIDELYEKHSEFVKQLKCLIAHEGGDILIGETFKLLADIFNVYSAFLHNYNQAIETVKKCSANNPQFKKIVSTIVLNLQTEQSLTLEDLLHKPVARVQINALVFNDLLCCTPPNHPDHYLLKQAHDTIHSFLKQFNVVNQNLPFDSNKNLRRMVKNSFIVELVDGHRKLRHLFLFNDVIACAKYKASGRDRIDYELKWFILLKDIKTDQEGNITTDLKESSPANILHLKTQACTVRDHLLMEEKDEKSRKVNGLKAGEKYRRKLADLESQLVLASPNLVFRLGNKCTNKTYTFFLSSDYERSQWIDSITNLKGTCGIPGANAINALEIHAFIVAMQKSMKIEMGSYLMRNTNDESLLVGDLHMTVHNLTGLKLPANMYVCVEVDSYGHYFRKASTKLICRTINPNWNESFVVELEGSQNVRILLYEVKDDNVILVAKHVLKLSRAWLQETAHLHSLQLGDSFTLNTTLRFVPGEVTLRRIPTSKPGALFGAKMQQVLKREKRDIPFIISACIREVERRGMLEVGIYRVSGSASDLAKLKKSFETNAYEAEQLLKDVDIHSVTGILKSYLRELPEALFTDVLYLKLLDTFSRYSNNNDRERIDALLQVFEGLPQANKASVNYILDHLIRVHHKEAENKMSLHNLAMVFGPTLLRPGAMQTKQKDILAASTADVMAQAGILYCFLQARVKEDK